MADKDIVKEAIEEFDRAEQHEHDARRDWLDDMRFARLGEQWPQDVERQRKLEGRPCLTINRLPAFIRQVTNDARRNSPSIKFHAVGDGADAETAEILNGLTRNIEVSSNADVAYDTALDHSVTGGFGYFRIGTKYARDDVFDQDICIERVSNPLSIYGDPDSVEADSSDWNKAWVVDSLRKSEFEKRWPGAETSAWESDDVSQTARNWFQESEIKVAEYWTRDAVPATLIRLSDGVILYQDEYEKIKPILDIQGIRVVGTRPTTTSKVTQRIISGAEVLETNKWAGKYIPIVPVYGDEILLDGKRHFISMVRFAKDPQRMFNYWRTTATELVALQPKTPFIGPKGAFVTDAMKWNTANTQSHAYIEYDGNTPPQRQPHMGPPAGALQEALNASDDMKSIMGLYNASLGAQGNETSGVAINARKQEGDISTFNYIDNLSRAIRHAGRIICDLIPRVYNTERIIRIIHEDETSEMVPVNQPTQQRPPPGQQPGIPPQAPPNPFVQPPGASMMQDPQDLDAITRVYDLTTGKYDVTCEVGPSFSTAREEAAAQMTEFIRAYPPAAQVMGDLLAKNMDWPGADEIADRLKLLLPPPIQHMNNPAVQQLQQQLQQQDGQARQAIGQLQQKNQQMAADQSAAQQELQLKYAELQSHNQLRSQELSIKERELQVKQAELALKAQQPTEFRVQA